MPRFAAIDIGSNAIRLRIVEATQAGRWQNIASSRATIRLGGDVFVLGMLSDSSIDQVCDALGRFREAMNEHNVDVYRAVATSAVREASNHKKLVERVREKIGIALEIISGTHEANLIETAVIRNMALSDRRALLVDVGGGSTEVTLIDHKNRVFAQSFPLGTVRLLNVLNHETGPVDFDASTQLDETVRKGFEPIESAFTREDFDVFVGTGGNVDVLFELCERKWGTVGGNPPSVDTRNLPELYKELGGMNATDRITAFRLRADRADTIVPGIAIVDHLAKLFGYPPLVAPGVGLKEGILEELVGDFFRTKAT